MCSLLFKLNSSSFIVFNMNQTCLPVKGLELKVGPKIIIYILFMTLVAFYPSYKSYVSFCFIYCGDNQIT